MAITFQTNSLLQEFAWEERFKLALAGVRDVVWRPTKTHDARYVVVIFDDGEVAFESTKKAAEYLRTLTKLS